MHIKENIYKRQRNILLTTPIHDNQLAKIIYAFNSTRINNKKDKNSAIIFNSIQSNKS